MLVILILLSNSNNVFANVDDEFAEFDKPKIFITDPFEQYNRKIFTVNAYVDDNILIPVTKQYIQFTSEDFRNKVSNFVTNLYTPSDIIIATTQGDMQSMAILSWRFAINSTLGLFGLFDVASELGLSKITKNFSDTLNLYGVPMGHYIVLPILGPSSMRNAVDWPVNALLNLSLEKLPIAYRFLNEDAWIADILKDRAFNTIAGSLIVLDIRTKLLPITEDLNKSSVDRYTAYRDMYAQFSKYNSDLRIKIIKNGIYQKPQWHSENIHSTTDYCINNPTFEECDVSARFWTK